MELNHSKCIYRCGGVLQDSVTFCSQISCNSFSRLLTRLKIGTCCVGSCHLIWKVFNEGFDPYVADASSGAAWAVTAWFTKTTIVCETEVPSTMATFAVRVLMFLLTERVNGEEAVVRQPLLFT